MLSQFPPKKTFEALQLPAWLPVYHVMLEEDFGAARVQSGTVSAPKGHKRQLSA